MFLFIPAGLYLGFFSTVRKRVGEMILFCIEQDVEHKLSLWLCVLLQVSVTPLSAVKAIDRLHGSDTTTTTPQTQDSQSTQLTQSPDILAVSDMTPESLLWVDKYKPMNIRQIIGQQGDRSNAKKLLAWLQNWHANLGRKPACEYVGNTLLFCSTIQNIPAEK